MVYWRNCPTVTLVRYVEGKMVVVRELRNTGQGMLPAGLTLVFLGNGGQAKEA